MTVTEAPRTRRSALWAPDRRATTTGLLILVTIAAFEALAVNTALPTIARDLHGGAFYSWVFTAMLAASVVGTVLSGTLSDRYGPAPGLLAGPVLFFAGLLVAEFAPTMPAAVTHQTLRLAAPASGHEPVSTRKPGGNRRWQRGGPRALARLEPRTRRVYAATSTRASL